MYENKMTTKEKHKNKNMLLYKDRYRQRIEIPIEVEDQLSAKSAYKKWSGHLLAYIVSFKIPLIEKDVKKLTILAKNSGWTLRQEHGELSEDYSVSGDFWPELTSEQLHQIREELLKKRYPLKFKYRGKLVDFDY